MWCLKYINIGIPLWTLEILKIIGVKEEKHPNVPFPYKLLPTFNYHASKSNEEKIQSFILNIVEMGFN